MAALEQRGPGSTTMPAGCGALPGPAARARSTFAAADDDDEQAPEISCAVFQQRAGIGTPLLEPSSYGALVDAVCGGGEDGKVGCGEGGAAAVDVVLFGEVHDDPAAHLLEEQLYTAMVTASPTRRCVLSMEMLERGCEERLERHRGGEAELREALQWGNWEDYAALVDVANASGSPVVPANPPRSAVSAAYREGAAALALLPESERALLPELPMWPPSAALRAKLGQIFAAVSPRRDHEDVAEYEGRVDRLAGAQNLRDAAMATAIAGAAKRHPQLQVLHVCGKAHVEGFLGVPEHLRRLAPHLNVLVVICVPTSFDQAGTDQGIASSPEMAAAADFVVFSASEVRTVTG